MNKKMLLFAAAFIMCAGPISSTKASVAKTSYFTFVGGLINAKLWVMKKILSEQDFKAQCLNHTDSYLLHLSYYSQFVAHIKNSKKLRIIT